MLRRIEKLFAKVRPSESARYRQSSSRLDRRNFLRVGALTGAAGASFGGLTTTAAADTAVNQAQAPSTLNEVTILELQAKMTAGDLTALDLLNYYVKRIQVLDQTGQDGQNGGANNGPRVNSILELNPDAHAIALERDAERRKGQVKGPLHGIPILLKDNIDTADKLQTAAGSLALVGMPAMQDSTVAAKLRAGGAVIMGKANLSEWANFRGFSSTSGWSGRGGQCNNPYILDANPCGSSSGSGAAVSANFTAGSLGTETDGSIVCPSNNNGVVGIKTTLGLTSRAGVVPISHNQDVVGPHGRTVSDAAVILGVIASQSPDPRDPATFAHRDQVFRDYTQFLNPDGLRGARIGVMRQGVTGGSSKTDAIYETAIRAMRDAGAIMVDPADIPTIGEIIAFASEFTVLIYDFLRDLNAYLSTRIGVPIKTLADAIAFNQAHADLELKYFGQELFLLAQSDPFTQADYQAALAHERAIGGPQGIDAVLQQFGLDALVSPTAWPAWTTDLINGDHFLAEGSSSPAAIAGYPAINVPMGNSFGLPVGITFTGTAFSEPTIIKLASGFEHVI
ncbi:MAG: amidase [Acidobacteria bacterium]|nr:MAG: amidase [Acidobacteriota bacterium]